MKRYETFMIENCGGIWIVLLNLVALGHGVRFDVIHQGAAHQVAAAEVGHGARFDVIHQVAAPAVGHRARFPVIHQGAAPAVGHGGRVLS